MHMAAQHGIVLPEQLPVLGTYRAAKRQAVASGTITGETGPAVPACYEHIATKAAFSASSCASRAVSWPRRLPSALPQEQG